MRPRSFCVSILGLFVATGFVAGAQKTDHAWVAKSNAYTQQLLDIQLEHSPEGGSRQGLVKFDERISNPTLADLMVTRKQEESLLEKLKAAQAMETDKNVVQDLEILQKNVKLGLRLVDYSLAHNVPYLNASSYVFSGLRGLLDDQVASERRPSAVVRLRKYAGVEPGYKPLTEILKQRTLEQIAKPGTIYPPKVEVETELGRNKNYVDGIPALFKKYKITGWEEPYANLKTELEEYDAWVRATISPSHSFRKADILSSMTSRDFRRIALSFDDAEESSHMGSPDFRVGGRIFATLASEKQGYGNLMLTPELQAAFIADQPKMFLPIAGGWGRMGMTHIRLAPATEEVLAGALLAAYNLRLKKNESTRQPAKSRKRA